MIEFNINEKQKLSPKDAAYLESNEGELVAM
jgi:hypothetical protein